MIFHNFFKSYLLTNSLQSLYTSRTNNLQIFTTFKSDEPQFNVEYQRICRIKSIFCLLLWDNALSCWQIHFSGHFLNAKAGKRFVRTWPYFSEFIVPFSTAALGTQFNTIASLIATLRPNRWHFEKHVSHIKSARNLSVHLIWTSSHSKRSQNTN